MLFCRCVGELGAANDFAGIRVWHMGSVFLSLRGYGGAGSTGALRGAPGGWPAGGQPQKNRSGFEAIPTR